LDHSGPVIFGVYPGSAQILQSPDAYNDGKWHMVVASLGNSGMVLDVDGELVASRNDVTSAQSYSGVWRIGGDNLNGWPSQPNSNYVSGSIDEASVWDWALDQPTISDLYEVGSQGQPNDPPTAAFTSTKSGLTVSVDGSDSTDPDGTLSSYSWSWGDGTANGSGKTASHTYASSGTYTIKLTVTDNDGATDTTSRSLTVTLPNQAPTAEFSSSVSDLKVSVDGSDSSDPDGSISSYAWSWGDGSADGSGKTASHTYGSSGTYTIKLTVTDDDGATDSVSHSVTVSEAAPASVIAKDGFGRTSATGWGSADVGGAWTVAGSASLYSVGNGVGSISLARAGSGPNAELKSVSARDVDVTTDVSLDKVPNGGGVYFFLAARNTSAGSVKAQLLYKNDGSVVIQLLRTVGGSDTVLAQKTVSGLTATDTVRLRFAAVGSGTTALSAKAWKVGASEPSAWTVTASDSNAATQGAGDLVIRSYLSGSASNFPIVTTIDNFSATDASDDDA
jgi:PKD repeat protein